MNQNRIFGNGAKWAGGEVGRWEGGSHAVNGDNDVAKMHNEKRHKKGNALFEIARTGHSRGEGRGEGGKNEKYIYKKYAGACVCRKKAVILQREITL